MDNQDARSPTPTQWRYFTGTPSDSWNYADFDETAWPAAPAGFGTGYVSNSHINTAWTSYDIYMCKRFDMPATFAAAILSLHHDDDVEVYINGSQMFAAVGWDTAYKSDALPDEYRTVFKPGQSNIISVHCHNGGSGGYIDAGLSITVPIAAAARPRSGVAVNCGTLTAAQGRLDMSGLARRSGGRLRGFGLEGRLRAALSAKAGQGFLDLPAAFGTGVFRYRWDSPSGSGQGALVYLH